VQLNYTHSTKHQLVAQCFYSLTIVPTCFGLSRWPSSKSLRVFRRVQLRRQLVRQVSHKLTPKLPEDGQ